MAFLYSDLTEVSPYLKARKKFYTPEAWTKMINALKTSTTLYIGNLSFYTDEEQVYTLFSLCGPVRRVIMGIHKYTHLPCGFCFVEYYFHRDAMAARDYLNGTKLDDRIIRVDLDPGFEPGRQFGRGATGGQVRDDRRHDYDEGRGGLPPRHKQRIEKHAIAQGQLVGPTNGPINNDTHGHLRHRYEQNMTVNDSKENKESKDNKDNKDNKDAKNKDTKDQDKDIKKDEDNKETASSANNNDNNNSTDNTDNKEPKKEEDDTKQIPSNDNTTNNGNNEETKMEIDNDNNGNHTQNGDHDKNEDQDNDTSNDTKMTPSNDDIAPPSENQQEDTTTTDDIEHPPLKKQKIDTSINNE